MIILIEKRPIVMTFFIILFFIIPFITGAIVDTSPPPQNTQTGTGQPVGLDNPLGSVTTLDGFISAVLKVVIGVAYAVAGFFLLLSGFRFVTAQGNEEKLKKAKNTFYFTMIGILLIVGAQVIIDVLKDVIIQITASGGN